MDIKLMIIDPLTKSLLLVAYKGYFEHQFYYLVLMWLRYSWFFVSHLINLKDSINFIFVFFYVVMYMKFREWQCMFEFYLGP
jgi:hypothetical protein